MTTHVNAQLAHTILAEQVDTPYHGWVPKAAPPISSVDRAKADVRKAHEMARIAREIIHHRERTGFYEFNLCRDCDVAWAVEKEQELDEAEETLRVFEELAAKEEA